MSYEFALDKKSIISLVAGWIFIAALLFLAGWLVGRQWPMTEAASVPSAGAEDQHAELPKEPVLSDEAPARELRMPKKPVAPTVTQPAAPNPPSAAAAVERSASAAATAAAAPAPANDGKVVIISEAETDETNKQDATEPEYVTVQVGVFLDAKQANSLLQQMERKGYAPTFFSGRDAEARQWYAVRIGSYSDKEQATRAAANFTKQEKIKAVVRPVESL
jgi:cell division protein FtsN